MSEFETWFIQQYFFDREQFDQFFKLKDGKYAPKVHTNEVYSIVLRLNFMLDAWNARQKEIDQLKAQLIDQGQRFNDQSQKVRSLEFFKVGDSATIENATQIMNEMRTRGQKLQKECDQLKAEKAGFEKQERINAECIKNLVKQKADYLHKVTMATAHLDSFDHSNAGMNKLVRSIESALEALRGES